MWIFWGRRCDINKKLISSLAIADFHRASRRLRQINQNTFTASYVVWHKTHCKYLCERDMDIVRPIRIFREAILVTPFSRPMTCNNRFLLIMTNRTVQLDLHCTSRHHRDNISLSRWLDRWQYRLSIQMFKLIFNDYIEDLQQHWFSVILPIGSWYPDANWANLNVPQLRVWHARAITVSFKPSHTRQVWGET